MLLSSALLRRVDELPDEADDGQREHHGQEEDALVDAACRGSSCRAGTANSSPSIVGTSVRKTSQMHVVAEGRPERRVDRRRSAGSCGSRPTRSCRDPPMPSQLVNERNDGERSSGTHTQDPTTTKQRHADHQARPRCTCRRPLSSARHGGELTRTAACHQHEDGLLLLLDARWSSPSMSSGFLMKSCSAGIITVRGEVGPRVAVEELRDLLGPGDQLVRLVLDARCSCWCPPRCWRRRCSGRS